MFLCLFAGGAVQQLPQGLGSGTASQLATYTNVRWAVIWLLSHAWCLLAGHVIKCLLWPCVLPSNPN